MIFIDNISAYMFWKVRKERDVSHYSKVLTFSEKLVTSMRIVGRHGFKGVIKAFENEKVYYRAILDGKIGYCLYKGIKSN